MSITNQLKQTIAITLSLIILHGTAAAQSSSSRESNVLFIAVDDLNTPPHVLSDETTVQTPNNGELADMGVMFTTSVTRKPPNVIVVVTDDQGYGGAI